MNKYRLGFLAAVLVGIAASAGTVKTWSAGEYITAGDLNSTIAHLHASVGHGHGPVIVNSDVSASAAIAHSKLATPALVPKAWAAMTATCSTGACTMVDTSEIASIVYSGVTDGGVGVGQYTVTYSVPRVDSSYMTLVSGFSVSVDFDCHTTVQTTTTATVNCLTPSTGAPTNGAFSFLMMDTEN